MFTAATYCAARKPASEEPEEPVYGVCPACKHWRALQPSGFCVRCYGECRECGEEKLFKRKFLCRACYNDKLKREKHPRNPKNAPRDTDQPIPSKQQKKTFLPTDAVPGSREWWEVIRRRVDGKQPVNHPDDFPKRDPENREDLPAEPPPEK